MDNIALLTTLTPSEMRQLVREEIEEALKNFKATNQQNTRKKTLSFKEGCKYVNISTSHGYKLTSKRMIPFSKQGKKIYFNVEELDRWMLENKVVQTSEMLEDVETYLNKKGVSYE